MHCTADYFEIIDKFRALPSTFGRLDRCDEAVAGRLVLCGATRNGERTVSPISICWHVC